MENPLFQSDDLDSLLNFATFDSFQTSQTADNAPGIDDSHDILSFDTSQLLNGSHGDHVDQHDMIATKAIGRGPQSEFQGTQQKRVQLNDATDLYHNHHDESMKGSWMSQSTNALPLHKNEAPRPVSDFPAKRRKSEPNIRAPLSMTSYNQGQDALLGEVLEQQQHIPGPHDRRSSFALTSDPIFMDPSNMGPPPERRNSITAATAQQAPYPARRNSVTQVQTPPTPTQPQGKREFDAQWAKNKLLDTLYGEKNVDNFCAQVVNFICNYTKMHVAGFYLNTQKQWDVKEWNLQYAFPSLSVFGKFFHYSLGCRQIMQASMEKRCFCVHNTQLKNSDSLSFMFVPLPCEEGRKFSLGVMVLGTILHNEQDLHTHLLFLDQIRRAIYVPFLTILSLQEKSNLMQGLDVLLAENQILKKRNRFERALVSLLAATENTYGKRVSIICSNTSGLITYASPGTELLLGYAAGELVGNNNLLKVHYPQEIIQRAKDLQAELGKSVVPGLGVIVERTMRNRGKEDVRPWTYVRKDGSLVPVRVIIKPLHDDKSIFGFVEVAIDLTNEHGESGTVFPEMTQELLDPRDFFSSPGQAGTFDIPATSTTTLHSPMPEPVGHGFGDMMHHGHLDPMGTVDMGQPATPNSVNDLMKSLFNDDGEDLNIDKWF